MALMEDVQQKGVASPGSSAVPDAEMLSPDSDSDSSPSPSSAARTKEKENRKQEERTCHMMPCSIDYQGMASTHVYFRPVEADGVLSSTFRGRGLLALSSTPKQDKNRNNHEDDDVDKDQQYLSAALLSVQNQQLQIKAEIDDILEWHHEHNPETLFLRNSDGTATSRVEVAQDWCEVALALHEAIPVEQKVPVA